MAYLVLFSRSLLGLTFAVAAASKVWGRAGFADYVDWVRALRLLPARTPGALVGPVAGALVAAEVLVVLLLAARPGAGLAAAGLVLAVFTAGTALAVRRGAAVGCRCFGASTGRLGRRHVVRDLALLGSAVAGLAATTAGGAAPVHLVPAAVTVAGALVAAAAAMRIDDLAYLINGTPSPSPTPHGRHR